MANEFTDDNFQTEVLSADKPVLVDFWAEWCGPCRAQGPIVDELATKYQGKIKVGKLNVDFAGQTAGRFQIRSIPTLLLFQKGAVVRQFVGLRSKEELSKAIDEVLTAK